MAYLQKYKWFFIFLLFQQKFPQAKPLAINQMLAKVGAEIILKSDLEAAQKNALTAINKITSNDEKDRNKHKKVKTQPTKPPENIANDPDFEKKILDQLINEKLVEQEINKKNLDATDTDIDNAISEIMRQNQFGNISQLNQALKNENISMEDYRESLRKQMNHSRFLNYFIRPKVNITPEDELQHQKKLYPDATILTQEQKQTANEDLLKIETARVFDHFILNLRKNSKIVFFK